MLRNFLTMSFALFLLLSVFAPSGIIQTLFLEGFDSGVFLTSGARPKPTYSLSAVFHAKNES
jgi:hypothetical protein